MGLNRGVNPSEALPGFYPAPGYIAVNIVDQEGTEAYDHRQMTEVAKRRRAPKNYKHEVICRVCKRIIFASQERKISGNKACRDRKGAYGKIACA